MQLFDLSWQGAGNTGAGAGTLTVTVFVTNVVGATKAVVSTVTVTPRSSARLAMSGLSAAVTTSVRSATASAKTASAVVPVG